MQQNRLEIWGTGEGMSMYKIDDIGSMYRSLPPNMQDIDSQCFAYAVDRQMKQFVALAKALTIWSDLDHVDPKYYDHMAMCIRASYYKSEYDNEKKLGLIKTAIEAHRYAGSERAINQLIHTIFEDATFIPWHEYGGKPYHFRVKVYDILTGDAAALFAEVIQKVKAARSILDGIEISRRICGLVNMGACTISTCKGETIRQA